MITLRFLLLCSVGLLCAHCEVADPIATVTVKNTLDKPRSYETIVISADDMGDHDLSKVGVQSVSSGEWLITQAVDINGDGIADQLLFQPSIDPMTELAYQILPKEIEGNKEELEYCYSRFVPERTDDYAWENDRVAFRMFGPTAQEMVEQKIKGGTLTSGVDLWLKRVDYPIINKWYKKTTEGSGSYHEDTGEGVDNFHVGVSRGVGGVGAKVDDAYYFSKNFTKWRTIATGPLRTIFELQYDDWKAGDHIIKESKLISLDYGSNLTRFETQISGIDSIVVGITLHEMDGEVSADHDAAWLSYWQPHGDSELGAAIVLAPDILVDTAEYITDAKDLSHAYAKLKVQDDQVIYYAGFGWKKSEQFKNKVEWEHYLTDYADKINNPLVVSVSR